MKRSLDTVVSILPQWRRSLRADNRQPSTIKTYVLAATQLHDYLCEEGFETAVRRTAPSTLQPYGFRTPYAAHGANGGTPKRRRRWEHPLQ